MREISRNPGGDAGIMELCFFVPETLSLIILDYRFVLDGAGI